MISVEEIVHTYKELRATRNFFLQRSQEIANQYNGDIVVPVGGLGRAEKAAAVNLLGPALDEISMRSASVDPNNEFPPLRPGIDSSEALARGRRLAVTGWHKMNTVRLLDRLRYRYLYAYGMSPVSICPVGQNPNDKREIPHWRVWSPLNSFTAPTASRLDMEPPFAINYSQQTLAWLKARYPDQAMMIYKGSEPVRGQGYPASMRFDVLEYNDDVETVVVLVGKDRDPKSERWGAGSYTIGSGISQALELERYPNWADVPLTVCPGRITLDRMQGAFDSMISKFNRANKLQALEDLAIVRGIFPDEWVVSHPGDPQDPDIDVEANGAMGVRGVITHGTITTTNLQPGQMVGQAIDRLERVQSVEGRIPSDWGGESATNIRTARRGDAVESSTVSMPIQEQQELIAASREAENRRAIAIMRKWYGSRPTCFYVPMNGKPDSKYTDYTPNEVFETDTNFVTFPLPGTDSSGLVIELSQRVGTGEMSLQTMRENDPAIKDPILERDRVELEGLRKAIITSLEQQAQSGGMDPQTISRIAILKAAKHEDIEKVVDQVHKEMQAEQAAQAAAAAPVTTGGPPDPNAQPGMGPGMAPPGPVIPPVTQSMPSQQDLAGLLGALRAPSGAKPPAMAGA